MCMPHTVPSKQDHLCFKHWLLAWRHWEINWSSIGVSSGVEINQSKIFTYHSVRQWASSMTTTAQHRFDNSVIRHTRIALGSTALSGVLRNAWPNNTSENNIENYQWRLKCDDIICGMAILNCLICQKRLYQTMYNYFKFVHYSDVERAVKTSTTSRFYLSWFLQTDGKPNMTVPHYWPFVRGMYRWLADSRIKGE